MKSLAKLLRRVLGLMLVSTLLLLLLNLAAFFSVGRTRTANGGPYTAARTAAERFHRTESGYALEEELLTQLRREGVWALYIDDATGRVLWHTEDLPPEVPLHYTLADAARLSLGYVADYPTYAAGTGDGLLVLGYPKTRYWKHMTPSWDYAFIAHLPRTALLVLGANLALLFLLYAAADWKLLRSVRPLEEGIRALAQGEEVCLRERGALSELARRLNETSRLLSGQRRRLEQRETARANWIAGVSHDIRTPLSSLLVCADRLRSGEALPPALRREAEAILRQGQRIRDLVSDLNLASRLEYDMQPLGLETVNAVALVRQTAVDLLNAGETEGHPLRWAEEEAPPFCPVRADPELLRRAVTNLVLNSVRHNPAGCAVTLSVLREGDACLIRVEDDGAGLPPEALARLNAPPGPLSAGEAGQDRGLGLWLVRQIALSHRGETIFAPAPSGGLSVTLRLPL